MPTEQDLLGNFDPNAIAPSTGAGGSLPVSGADGHMVMITEHELKANKQPSTGSHILLTLMITEGPNSGSTGTHCLNLGHNASPQAVQIARSELSAICHCVGHTTVLQSISELYNRPFRVVVANQSGAEAIEKGYTEIKKFMDPQGQKPGQAGATATPSPSPGQAAPAPVAQPAAAAPVVAQPVVAVDQVAPIAQPVAAPAAVQPVGAPAVQPIAPQPAQPSQPAVAQPAWAQQQPGQ